MPMDYNKNLKTTDIKENAEEKPVKEKSENWKCIVSGIVNTLCIFITCCFITQSIKVLAIAFALNFCAALCYIFSGFYIVLILIPNLEGEFSGYVKKNVPLWLRVILTVGLCLLPLLSLLICACFG